jgi:ubiquinone/menaquinone biosynthesis C-methylase UbiE
MMSSKYDHIGKSYDQTRRADSYLLNQMYALLGAAVHGQVVDIGCGSGNYTIGLAQKGVSMTGIDPSQEMLGKARAKTSQIQWIHGTAEHIPLDDHTADGALASLTIHHWNDIEKGMAEIARILKPGGRFVLFGFTRQQMRGYWLNHYFPVTMENSIQVTPEINQVQASMRSAGV